MSRIIVEATSSDVAKKTVLNILNCGFVANTARISYSLSKGLPQTEDTDDYPLILEGELGKSYVDLHVYSVTAGYGGTGPHAMVDILNAAGFEFNESDILTPNCANSNNQINLLYTR